MKFGIYFSYWEQEWEAPLAPYCKKAADIGFDVLEVSGGGLMALDAAGLRNLKDTAAGEGISLTAGIGLPPQFDVSNEDAAVREKGIAYLSQLFEKMEQAGIGALGGNTYAYWPCDYAKPFEKQKAWERSVGSVKKLAEIAERHGVTLMMEVLNRFEHYLINDAAEGCRYVRDVGAKNVKVMLDSFHMNIEEDDMYAAIVNTGDLLGHFHIGECNRKVPGKGHMPWDDIARGLNEIDYQGAVVMEPFVRAGGGVGHDIKIFRDLSGGATDEQLTQELKESLVFVKERFLKV